MAGGFGASQGSAFALREIEKNAKAVGKHLEETALEVVDAIAREVQIQAKKRFVAQGTGDQPDGFGLRPHRITGQLSRSISRRVDKGNGFVEGVVFTTNFTEQYAAPVELGSETSKRRTRPHPYLRPALEVSKVAFFRGVGTLKKLFR